MTEALKDYIGSITPSNKSVGKQMQAYMDGLTKPVGSLGKMEELISQLASIQETMAVEIDKKVTLIMCADNGVWDQGVSSCPQEVTKTVTNNFTKGITAMNKMSAFVKSELHIVDIGVKGMVESPDVHSCKIAHGTKDMTKGMAMTHEEAEAAIWVGIRETEKLIEADYQVFGTGEMGIGNTTTSAALVAVLLDLPVESVTGRGAGALDRVYKQKVAAIKKAIDFNKPNPNNPLDVLAKVGGFDLAGLVGVYLACAKHKKMVVLDGFISSTAALIAFKLNPVVKDYMVASHLSKEVGMMAVMDEIGLEAHMMMSMRLGEGSGCPLLFQLLDLSHYTLLSMGTFEEAQVDRSRYEGIWK